MKIKYRVITEMIKEVVDDVCCMDALRDDINNSVIASASLNDNIQNIERSEFVRETIINPDILDEHYSPGFSSTRFTLVRDYLLHIKEK